MGGKFPTSIASWHRKIMRNIERAEKEDRMFKKLEVGILAPAIAIACLCVPGAAAQTTTHNPSSSTGRSATSKTSDTTFIKKAAEGGLAEVQLGQLAAQKAESQQVKQFGQRMVDDHTKANDQLKQVASEKGVNIPEKLDAKDAATKARLEKLSGAEFDRAYMADMVRDHTKDVREFENEANTAKDPAVKNFASQTLPTLKDHLKEAKSVASQVGATTAHKSMHHSQTGT
jgi:putative membrane protein